MMFLNFDSLFISIIFAQFNNNKIPTSHELHELYISPKLSIHSCHKLSPLLSESRIKIAKYRIKFFVVEPSSTENSFKT